MRKAHEIENARFIARQQSASVKELKINLQPGRFIVCFDFTENYAFVVQNSVQSFHWNNNQATIFTVVIYYVKNGELKHRSLAIISDNLAHDTYSVHQYQKIIIEYLKKNFELVTNIFYVTDGASQHFKNKSNFTYLVAHEKDFGVVAEWHFHATAHGKGACDGVGANLKRGAKQATLQCSSQHHILTLQSLFKWAKKYCKEIKVFFSGEGVYEQVKNELKLRFDMNTDPIPGTLQSHAFIPTSDSLLMFKKYSLASEYNIFPQKRGHRKERVRSPREERPRQRKTLRQNRKQRNVLR
ncbi:hypothetical protein QAD02_013584 [Eretmocerus hayati]|uniref:Uncharacterized protein n=1 Tax=Eretmocerus hayati TaxID=131215 RepID=A0ACC2P335_9HYME|nr:hypothetical protein QAD02_013584 [Eretmocerus hayati]